MPPKSKTTYLAADLHPQRPDAKWLIKRMKMRKIKITKLSEEVSSNPQAISRVLSGTRQPRIEEIIALCRELEISTDLCLVKLGFAPKLKHTPVVGDVLESGAVVLRLEKAWDNAPFIRELDQGALSEHESTMRALVYSAPHGLGSQLLYWEPSVTVRRDADSRLSVCTTDVFPNGVVAKPEAAGIRSVKLTLFDGTEVETDTLLTASPIRWIRYW